MTGTKPKQVNEVDPSDRDEANNLPLLNEKQAAKLLNVSVYFLRKDRCTQHPEIPFVRLKSVVRYRPRDLYQVVLNNVKT